MSLMISKFLTAGSSDIPSDVYQWLLIKRPRIFFNNFIMTLFQVRRCMINKSTSYFLKCFNVLPTFYEKEYLIPRYLPRLKTIRRLEHSASRFTMNFRHLRNINSKEHINQKKAFRNFKSFLSSARDLKSISYNGKAG